MIDFQKTFGKGSNAASNASDRPKAQLWLNIGYDSGVVDEEGKSRFVSLPTGIPLDTQEALPTNSRNADFRAFQSARNDLMTQILEAGKSLAPGEEKILNLSIQLRRVSEEAAAVAPEDNQYAQAIAL